MMITAGIPSGCACHEFMISPLKSQVMEVPSPHPGHQSKPQFASGQRL
jgi:hypothetical protein